MTEVASLAKLLHDYGPWALVAMSLIAIAWLARMYVKARDDRDLAVGEIYQGTGKVIEKNTEALTVGAQKNEQVAAALLEVGRRLENAERAIAELTRPNPSKSGVHRR